MVDLNGEWIPLVRWDLRISTRGWNAIARFAALAWDVAFDGVGGSVDEEDEILGLRRK